MRKSLYELWLCFLYSVNLIKLNFLRFLSIVIGLSVLGGAIEFLIYGNNKPGFTDLSVDISEAQIISGFLSELFTGVLLFIFSICLIAESKDKSYEILKIKLKKTFRLFLIYLRITVVVCLWSLLFVIPGIIVLFRYTLIDCYILQTNMDYNGARKLSIEKMKGYKFLSLIFFVISGLLIFVLDLILNSVFLFIPQITLLDNIMGFISLYIWWSIMTLTYYRLWINLQEDLGSEVTHQESNEISIK